MKVTVQHLKFTFKLKTFSKMKAFDKWFPDAFYTRKSNITRIECVIVCT